MCSAVGALQESWEEKLAEEGLEPLPVDPSGRAGSSHFHLPLRGPAIDSWTTWAKGILETLDANEELQRGRKFDTSRRREIWELYSDGTKYSEIASAVGCHRSIVVRTVARIVACSPPAPAVNPWGRFVPVPKSRPEVLETMLRAIADCADPWLLRERIAADPVLSQLAGGMMSKSATVTYSKILLRKPEDFYTAIGVRNRDFLENIEGRAHGGGIDVIGADGLLTTVPWGEIRKAVRAVEVES
jgi:hypothetical protein